MSTKRILGITVFGILFIAVVIGIMLLASYLKRDIEAIELPDNPVATQPAGDEAEPDALNRVEITRDTIQAVVSELSRPDAYSRDIVIGIYWEDGMATYTINVNVIDGATSLLIQLPAISPSGTLVVDEKRIIIVADKLYIWYKGDQIPYTRDIDSSGDWYRTADEWQMMVTYEDLLSLDIEDIIDAGYEEYDGEDCIFAEYLSPLLGYTRKYYVSVDLGLVVGAQEYDDTGVLVYSMTAGECMVGEVDYTAFILPDGDEMVSPLDNPQS